MEYLRTYAAGSWTDHNAHDPGITLLEAFCYVETEIGLRMGMPLEDLLAGGENDPEFFTAAAVLPSAAVTARDFQLLLCDHALVQNAWMTPLESDPGGQWRVLVEWAEEELNGSVFPEVVAPPALAPQTYRVEVAFPAWDEDEVRPLREEVDLTGALLLGGGNPWLPIEGDSGYFARVRITYEPSGGGVAQDFECWVVVQIVSPLTDPLTERGPILAATRTLLETLGDNSPADNSLLKRYNRRVTAAAAAGAQLRRFVADYRNLAESFAELRAVRIQEVAITANVTVDDDADLNQLLLSIYRALDAHVAPPEAVHSLEEGMTAVGQDAARLFEGPLPGNGFRVNTDTPSTERRTKIYASDLLRLIFQQADPGGSDVTARADLAGRHIVGVSNLTMSNYIDNRIVTTQARNCLQLIDSSLHVARFSPGKSRIQFFRGGLPIDFDPQNALNLFRAEQLVLPQANFPETDLALPVGQARPLADYYPLQNDLPRNYGVGEAGLPQSADATRRGQARQLKGYLFFLEQLLAGQLAHLYRVNEFFSADLGLTTTRPQQSFHQFSDAPALFRGFDPAAQSWESFIADEQNAYRRALAAAAEDESTFLERRNRMLDHLLARQGESLAAYAGLRYREMGVYLSQLQLPLPDILARQSVLQRLVARELMMAKSHFYYDLPLLNRRRLLGWQNPAFRPGAHFQLLEEPEGIGWEILDETGTPQFRHANPAVNPVLAQRSLALAFRLLTEPQHCFVEAADGGRVVFLRAEEGTEAVGRSSTIFPNIPAAQASIGPAVVSTRERWYRLSLSPMEIRLYHEIGITPRERRRLLNDLNDHWEIYDEVDADAIIEKRFRFWSLSGQNGDILLESFGNYPGPNDADATADARSAIEDLLPLATQGIAYRIEAVGSQFRLDIPRTDGTSIAVHPNLLNSRDEATAMAVTIRHAIFRVYAGEGFYLVDNAMLYSEDNASPVLDSPSPNLDAYRQQLTLVFPSGQSRDFSIPDGPTRRSGSGRYAAADFRRYVEERTLAACPAHLIPRVWWVDRATPGTPLAPNDPAFDHFETAYSEWLSEWLRDLPDPVTLANRRDQLVTVINHIIADQTTAP